MFTGELRDVRVCRVDGDDTYLFAFGYVVSHTLAQYDSGDWFATSLITSIYDSQGQKVIKTLNSEYLVDATPLIDIPSSAINNIRNGTSPEKAVALVRGELFAKQDLPYC